MPYTKESVGLFLGGQLRRPVLVRLPLGHPTLSVNAVREATHLQHGPVINPPNQSLHFTCCQSCMPLEHIATLAKSTCILLAFLLIC